MEPRKLFKEFPPVTKEQWRDLAVKDLKGADFDKKLVWHTYEGFSVQPFYTIEDLSELNDFVEQISNVQKHSTKWINYAEVQFADPVVMNEKALLAVKNGATGLLFEVYDTAAFNFDAVLRNVNLAQLNISFRTGAPSEKFLRAYFNYVNSRNISLSAIKGFCDIDILDQWIIEGVTPDFAALERQIKVTKEAPHFSGLVVHSGSFADAGCNSVQEPAFLFNKVVDYIDYLTGNGFTASEILDEITINSATGGDYFFEIAKLRALRVVWNEIINAYGITGKEAQILSSSSRWTKGCYDPDVNMLRNTTEAMAAIIGGCNGLLITPHNAACEKPNDFTRRIALNISNILQMESYFDKVIDPSKGSYYIEYLTKTISEKALGLFKEIEKAGGFIAAFGQNIIQDKIEMTRKKKEQDIATRRQVYVGVNQYVNSNEKVVITDSTNSDQISGVKLLPRQRATLLFERLRTRTQEYLKNTGKLPKVYLACFGNLTMRKARASFSASFFNIAGFQILGEGHHERLDDCIKHSLQSDADIVVLCSSDEDYGRQAKDFAVHFREANSNKTLVLAGYPAALVEELKSAGVDLFIHVKTNVIEVISSLHDRLLTTV